MRISPRTRQTAVRALELAGINHISIMELAPRGAVFDLAWDAYSTVMMLRAHLLRHGHELTYVLLEAACLLRDGWCPGDPCRARPRREDF